MNKIKEIIAGIAVEVMTIICIIRIRIEMYKLSARFSAWLTEKEYGQLTASNRIEIWKIYLNKAVDVLAERTDIDDTNIKEYANIVLIKMKDMYMYDKYTV